MPKAETYVARVERELVASLKGKGVAVDQCSPVAALRELTVMAPRYVIEVAARERRLLRVLEALNWGE